MSSDAQAYRQVKTHALQDQTTFLVIFPVALSAFKFNGPLGESPMKPCLGTSDLTLVCTSQFRVRICPSPALAYTGGYSYLVSSVLSLISRVN